MDKIIQALTAAYKRDHEGVENVIVDVNEETAGPADVRAEGGRGGGGEPRLTEITLEEARAMSAKYRAGRRGEHPREATWSSAASPPATASRSSSRACGRPSRA